MSVVNEGELFTACNSQSLLNPKWQRLTEIIYFFCLNSLPLKPRGVLANLLSV